MKNQLKQYHGLLLCLFQFALMAMVSLLIYTPIVHAKVPWDLKIRPGDVVCIYDISKEDPLVDNKSSDSLKYWYRSPAGDQKSRYQLRPMVRNLQLRVLWPGFVVSEKEKDGYWYSGIAVVTKGGRRPGKKAYPVHKGENILMRDNQRTVIMNWQTLYFEHVRLKKNPKGPKGCNRKYKQY
jgi:hypothetical protein